MTENAAPAAATRLEVTSMSAGYSRLAVVHDFSVTISEGEIVALLGRNGAGKTTTLLAIAGYLPRTTGEVKVCGLPLRGPTHRRTAADLGMVLEGRSVFASLTVGRNLAVANVDAVQVTKLFPELVARLDVPAGMISGGEQQMLALARAMAREPRVLLIDELSFGLSPIVCDRLFGALRQFGGIHRNCRASG